MKKRVISLILFLFAFYSITIADLQYPNYEFIQDSFVTLAINAAGVSYYNFYII